MKITMLACGALLAISTPVLAEGDVGKGEKIFRKCIACHTLEEGKNKVGPTLTASLVEQRARLKIINTQRQ